VTFSPDGQYVATASQNAVALWKASYGNEVAQLAHPDDIVVAVGFSPDGHRLVTAAGTTARIWDLGNGRELYRLKHDSAVDDVVFTADGASIDTATKPQAAEANQTCVHVWEAGSGVLRRDLCQGLSAKAFSPDGSHVVLAERHSGVSVRNLATGALITRVKGIADPGFLSTLALSAQRHYVAVAIDTRESPALYIADVAGDAPPKKIPLNSRASQLAFSADERRLAAATGEGVTLWEVGSGREIARITLSAGANTIAYAADGQHLATGSRDRSVRVWEIPQIKEVARFELGGNISRVAFSPDMELIAAASSDRTARVWRWKTDPAKEACTRLSRNLTPAEWQTYLGNEPYRTTCPGLPRLDSRSR
jgi:WD40 repeat protein